jgi:hypothetical protein
LAESALQWASASHQLTQSAGQTAVALLVHRKVLDADTEAGRRLPDRHDLRKS